MELTKLGNRVSCTGQRHQAVLLSPETPEDQVSILRPQFWVPWWEARLHLAFQMLPMWMWCAVRVQNHWTQGHGQDPRSEVWKKQSRNWGEGSITIPTLRGSPKPDRRNYNTIWGECSLHKSTHCLTDIQRRCFLLSPEQMFVKWELLVLLRVYWSLTS